MPQTRATARSSAAVYKARLGGSQGVADCLVWHPDLDLAAAGAEEEEEGGQEAWERGGQSTPRRRRRAVAADAGVRAAGLLRQVATGWASLRCGCDFVSWGGLPANDGPPNHEYKLIRCPCLAHALRLLSSPPLLQARPSTAPAAASRSPTSLDMWSQASRGRTGGGWCTHVVTLRADAGSAWELCPAGSCPELLSGPARVCVRCQASVYARNASQSPYEATSPRFKSRAAFEQRRCATPDM